MRASICDSVSRVRATSPSRRTKAASAVDRRRELAAARSRRGRRRRRRRPARPPPRVRSSGEVEVHSTSAPWKRVTCSATRVVVTGSAIRPPRRSAATRSSRTSSARSSWMSRAALVDERRAAPRRGRSARRTPPASSTPARRGARAPRMCSATRLGAWRVSSSRLLTVSTSTPSRPSSVGSTSAAAPPAVSSTTFSPASRRPRTSTVRSSSCDVGLDACGTGSVSSAISPGKARRNSCRLNDPLERGAGAAGDRSAPSASRKTMSIDCGSPGVVRRTTPPPARRCAAVSKRVTGSGDDLEVVRRRSRSR